MTTLDYYDDHADAFVQDTLHVDMTPVYAPFVSALSPGARVLDLGCGSGRDMLAFAKMGFQVEGRDGSIELVEKARHYTGLPIQCERFEDLHDQAAFEGIWACASLLHVPRAALSTVLQKLYDALTPNGVLYMSFKYGKEDRMDGERYYTDMTDELMIDLLEELSNAHVRFTILRMWQARDERPTVNQTWLNVLLKRES